MRIGIDLGGSHVAIGLIQDGKIFKKNEHNFTEEERQNVEKSIKEILDKEIDNISEIVNLNTIEKIGISMPGLVKNGRIIDSPNLKITDLNVEKIVKDKIDKPIYIKNDGICAGIAEKEYGNLKDSNNGVFIGLGTGIGSATFINGKLVEELRGVGHMIIERNGKKCNCGKNGCYETYASMKALKTQIRERLGNDNLSSKEILEILEKSNKTIELEGIIKNYIEYLAMGISNIARLYSADTIAIGGSFVYYKDVLFDRLKEELNRIMNEEEKEITKIKLAVLGNDAGMIGATLIN